MPASPNALLDQRVLGVLRAGGLLTAAQIGGALGLDRLPVRRALTRLQHRGLVRLVGLDQRPHALTDGGQPGIWEAMPTADG